MQTGRPFAIFQDRNDIAWGQNWQQRINNSLADVTFLIPVLTPSFFHSPACRSEFQTFHLKERMLGVNRLILPLYYVACDELGEAYVKGTDDIADTLRSRNWTDWRQFRFKPFSDETVASALASLAEMVKTSMKEIEAIGALAAKPAKTPKTKRPTPASRAQEIAIETGLLQPLQSKITKDPGSDKASEPTVASTIPEIRPIGSTKAVTLPADTFYYAYTKRFDEVIEAKDLADKSQLLTLYDYVSNYSAALKKLHESALLAKLGNFQKRGRGVPLAVSILIDNSGSMRGNKILHTAAWCLLIVEWMDRLGIPTEILGFTTRAWKGGQSREFWLANGKPKNPGRLNDLRHLVYKSFAMTAEVSAPNFGLMAREGLLKENIDGEALLWAAARLAEQPARNKILFVFSDGASVDDSTLSVNPGNFLERHLLAVIEKLSTEVTLYAIGIEHDVSRYYPNSLTSRDPSSLGLRFFDALVDDGAFKEFWTSGGRRGSASSTRRRAAKKDT